MCFYGLKICIIVVLDYNLCIEIHFSFYKVSLHFPKQPEIKYGTKYRQII